MLTSSLKDRMNVDEATQKRLIYVKALYLHGQQHAKSDAEFDRMIALHHFDNAVELLLKCIAINENASIGRNVSFPNLWDEVERKLRQRGISLQKRIEMQQLHDSRSDIQHWGATNLSLDTVSRYQVYSGDFIQTMLKEVFDIEFEELSLSMLVRDERIRDILSKAELTSTKDPKESMKYSAAAFSLARNREVKRINLPFSSPSLSLDFQDKARLQEVDKNAVPIAEILSSIWEPEIRGCTDVFEDLISLLVLDINITDYSRYRNVAPIAAWYKNGFVFQRNIQGDYVGDFTIQNAIYCFNFVLKQVFRWQEKW